MKIFLAIVFLLLVGAGILLYTPDESRAALEAKYHVAATDYVEVAGLRLHVADAGPHDAPAVIMLHGFGSSLQTFDAWAQALSTQFRVIRFDLPGFGLTGADPTGDYSDARSLVVIGALMDKLGLTKASFVGNSMGGRLAWMFTDGFASPGFEYGRAPDVPLMLRFLPYTLPKPMLRMTLAPAFADPRRLSGALVTRYWDFMRAPGVRQAVIDRTAQTILQDPTPLLRKIQAPTLLLWGEDDNMIPVANAADYMAAIGGCKLLRLPGLGHVPQEESPAASVVLVQDFLAQK